MSSRRKAPLKMASNKKAAPQPVEIPTPGELAYARGQQLYGLNTGTGQYNPSELMSRRGIRVIDRMKLDDQIKAALAFKKMTVISSGWEIASPDGYDGDWEPTEFVDYVFKHLDGAMQNVLLGILSALEYGFSITEKVWEERSTLQFGDVICLKALKSRPPHGFTFKSDDYGNLLDLYQSIAGQAAGGLSTGARRLDPSKFVIFSYNGEFSNHYGVSDLEAAYRPWFLKENAYRWMAMGLERLGIPPMFLFYDPRSYDSSQKAQFSKIITNLQATSGVTFPRPAHDRGSGTDILDLQVVQGGQQVKDVFPPIIDMLDKGIARALLMPGLLGFTPDADVGSLARSKKHFEAFLLVIEYIRECVSVTINESIVRPLALVNFPDLEDYPQFRFLPMTESAVQAVLDSWAKMIQSGAVIPQSSDEEHIRTILDFPEKDMSAVDINDIASGAVTLEQPKEKKAEVELGGEADNKVEDSKESKVDAEKEKKLADKPDDIRKHADKTIHRYDENVDYSSIKTFMASEQDKVVSKIAPLFNDVYFALRKKIMASKGDYKTLMRKLDGQWLPAFAPVRSAFKEFLKASYEQGATSVRKELPVTKKMAAGYQPKEAMKWLNDWEEFSISGLINDDLLKQAKLLLTQGMKNGDMPQEIVDKMWTSFEPYIGNDTVLKDGNPIPPYRLQTVVQTNMTAAMNQGRLVQARQDPEVLQGFQYSAVMDEVTTDICAGLDGRVFNPDDLDLDKLTPPNHFNCRSILVPISISQDVKAGDFITEDEKASAFDAIDEGFGGASSAYQEDKQAQVVIHNHIASHLASSGAFNGDLSQPKAKPDISLSDLKDQLLRAFKEAREDKAKLIERMSQFQDDPDSKQFADALDAMRVKEQENGQLISALMSKLAEISKDQLMGQE